MSIRRRDKVAQEKNATSLTLARSASRFINLSLGSVSRAVAALGRCLVMVVPLEES
jgi:hypothetical protein